MNRQYSNLILKNLVRKAYLISKITFSQAELFTLGTNRLPLELKESKTVKSFYDGLDKII